MHRRVKAVLLFLAGPGGGLAPPARRPPPWGGAAQCDDRIVPGPEGAIDERADHRRPDRRRPGALPRRARTVVGLAPGFEWSAEAERGEEAIDLARPDRPGLVLMDINLPGINGVEATRRILPPARDRGGPAVHLRRR